MARDLNHKEMIVMEVLLNHPNIGFYSALRFSEKQGYTFQVDDMKKTLETLREKGFVYLSDTEINKLSGEEIKRYSASCSREDYLAMLMQANPVYEEGLLGSAMAKLVDSIHDEGVLRAIKKRVDRKVRLK